MTKELAPVESAPPKALTRWKIALRHPAARLPLAIGVGCVMAYFFFAQSTLLLVTALTGLLAGAVGSAWVARQLEGQTVRLALDAKMQEHERLKRALSKLKWEGPVEREAEQASGQLEQLKTRFDLFEKALRSKMSPGELTYERYHSVAESVRVAVLQNLQTILTSLQSLLAISPQEHALRAAENSKLQALLAGNEQALLRLMEAAQAVGDIKTNRDSASTHLDATLQELKELAARASKYSSS